jgi:hypothetical protein
MAHTYQPLEEKEDISSIDAGAQDNESLLGIRKPSLASSRSNVFWLVLHMLLTFGLLVGLRIQSEQRTVPNCPKVLALEICELVMHYQY